MTASETARTEVLIGRPPAAVRFTAVGRGLGIQFDRNGLSGTWAVDPVAWPEWLDELQRVERSLQGQARLTDDESMSLTLTVGRTGAIVAELWVNLWIAFNAEGELRLQFDLEPSSLRLLIQDFRKLELEMSAARKERVS